MGHGFPSPSPAGTQVGKGDHEMDCDDYLTGPCHNPVGRMKLVAGHGTRRPYGTVPTLGLPLVVPSGYLVSQGSQPHFASVCPVMWLIVMLQAACFSSILNHPSTG